MFFYCRWLEPYLSNLVHTLALSNDMSPSYQVGQSLIEMLRLSYPAYIVCHADSEEGWSTEIFIRCGIPLSAMKRPARDRVILGATNYIGISSFKIWREAPLARIT